MCDHENREADMVTTHRKDDGTPSVWCDPCLEPLVRALNDGGLPTRASCCGHGKHPGRVALKDGRELFILPDFDSARALDDHFADETQRSAEKEAVRKPTTEEAEAILTLVRGGWLRLELTLNDDAEASHG